MDEPGTSAPYGAPDSGGGAHLASLNTGQPRIIGTKSGQPVYSAICKGPVDGRLAVRVSVPGAEQEAETEIVRENSLPKEHLDGWRQYICGRPPTEYR